MFSFVSHDHTHLTSLLTSLSGLWNALSFDGYCFFWRSDLKENMIPHRTKMQELIVRAWRKYFQALKGDLAVRTSDSFTM